MENKKTFVEGTLQTTIKEAYGNIANVQYGVTEYKEEYVIVRYNNGYIKKICVPANSLRAIVIDVFRELH